jgi:hypothetical protein
LETARIEITDASKELSFLGRHFLETATDPAGGNGFAGFASSFGVESATPIFFSLLSEVRRRIDALQTFAETVVDSELDDQLRAEVRQATVSFSNIFRPDFLSNRWEDTCKRMLPEANLKTLLWFGQTARRHRPLRVVSANERTQIIENLSKALIALNEDTELDWMKAPLVDGIHMLIVTIQHLRFFGHDYAIEQLIALNLKASVFQQARDAAPNRGQSDQSSIWKCLTALSVVSTLLILPDQAATAINRYQSWARDLIASTPRLPYEQRLLPPPAATVPKDTEVEAIE